MRCRSDRASAPQDTLCVGKRVGVRNPATAPLRRRIVHAKREHQPCFAAMSKARRHLLTPTGRDVAAGFAANPEVVVGNAVPLLDEGSAYPPGPPKTRRVAGTVDKGITHEADTQVVNSHTALLRPSAARRQFRQHRSSVTYTRHQPGSRTTLDSFKPVILLLPPTPAPDEEWPAGRRGGYEAISQVRATLEGISAGRMRGAG